MTRNITKKSRLDSREYQFNKLIESGYLRETFKALDFFTKQDGQYYTLKVFRGTAANHEDYRNYRSLESRSQAIENYKTNLESREAWKAEQKEKNKGKQSSHAAAATAIKAELQKAFPSIKFSVRSESFSMGNSVNISWTDGATEKQVKEITSKYQYGHFNGMEDIYENSNSREDIPQAKYVSEHRKMSEETRSILKPIAEQMFLEFGEGSYNCRDAEQFLYRIFCHCPIFGKVVNIVPTGETCGLASPEIFYKIECEKETVSSTVEATAPQYKEVETVQGEINIIDYSEKAFAVVGDTKPLKDKLKQLGGSFNARLSCGAGWIFSKKKMEEVIAALQPEQKEEVIQEETAVIPIPQTNFKLESFKIIWHEGNHSEGNSFDDAIFYNWADVQKTFVKLWEVNEKGQSGGYTKVKCEIKFVGQEAQICRVDITDQIKDGDFNPSDEHIVSYLQSIFEEEIETLRHPELELMHPLNLCDPQSNQYKEALKEYQEQPKEYNNLPAIREAAKSGQMISLLNLSNLVNNRANV